MDMDNYDMRFELQRSYFLRDLLSDVFEFDYENQEIKIYRIKGIVKERCCVGDVIYYLHIDHPIHELVPRVSEELSRASSRVRDFNKANPFGGDRRDLDEEYEKVRTRAGNCNSMMIHIVSYLGTIEQVKRLIENMVIIYECEPDESVEEKEPKPRAVKQMDHLPTYSRSIR